jgi:predicted metal-binding protein
MVSVEIIEDELKKRAFKDGACTVQPIDPKDVVVGNWVRMKCQFGCPSYGKKLSCPPYSPKPEETRKILNEYSKGYIIGYSGSALFKVDDIDNFGELFPQVLKEMRRSIFELEKYVFLSGYYKSFSYGFCGPCTYCKDCVVEKGSISCLYASESRPSMEAAGIDVFKTVNNLGLKLEVQKEFDPNRLRLYTLLLLE